MNSNLGVAVSSLQSHKLRAVLAMLGVFMGALALTGVQHVSKAMVLKAEVETEKLGPNLFMAKAGQIRVRRSGSIRNIGNAKTFSTADARALIDSMPQAVQGAAFVDDAMAVRFGEITTTARLVATEPNYPQVRSFQPQYGRFFTQQELEDREKVVVLGRTIAERLFGRPQDAIGQSVLFIRANAKVIGVMEEKGADLSGEDQDEQAFVPLTTYMRRFANQDWISGVYIQLQDGADTETAKEAAKAILRDRRGFGPGEQNDFSVLTAKDTMELQQQALDLVGALGVISSSVSFAVGGVGILSVMVLVVRARRLEIGVRRAVGATRGDIVRQFLFEAGLLSTVGGALGTAAAMGLMAVVYSVGDFPAVVDGRLILLVLFGSALLGLLAGYYPAMQASRYEILDVLRSRE